MDRKTSLVEWRPSGPRRNERLLRLCVLFEFCENDLRIRAKRKRWIVQADGTKIFTQLVPFHFNAVQEVLAQSMAWAWYEYRPHKVLTPKARQLGSSTWWQAILYGMATLSAGYHIATVAHTEDGVDDVFAKTKTFQKYVPNARDMEVNKEGRINWDNESSHWTGTVKTGDGLLKGPSPSAMHLTECANFSDKGVDADNAIASALNAVGDDPDAIVCYESTAKGNDPFFWKECERAKDPKGGTENRVLFLPWHLDPEYSMSWTEYKARLKGKDVPEHFVLTGAERVLREKLSKLKVTKQNCWYTYRTDLTDQQLIWRRFKIANDCFDKIELFQRYYPSTYEEAFTSTVTSLFSAETIKYYMERSKKCLSRGEVVDSGLQPLWLPDPKGFVQLWGHPIPGREYILSADVGGSRDNADPNSAFVLDSHSMSVMAEIHGFIEFDHYAAKLMDVGKYYNWALLVIENNYNPAVAKTCLKAGYPNLYHYEDEGSIKSNVQGRPGFHTNRLTKPELVAAISAACRDHTLDSKSVGFAREMSTFVQVISQGTTGQETFKATGTNHDDRIMSMAIGVFLCKGTEARAEDTGESYGEVWQFFLRHKRLQEERDEREARRADDAGAEILVL